MQNPQELVILQMAVHQGLISEQRKEQVVEKQKELLQRGKRISIPQLLIRLGLLSAPQIKNLLQKSQQGYLRCPSCNKVFPLSERGMSSGSYSCPHCQKTLSHNGGSPSKKKNQTPNQTRVQNPEKETDTGLTNSLTPGNGRTQGGGANPQDRLQSLVGKPLEIKPPEGYQVLSTLGQGGFGLVYSLRDPISGRSMAMKVLSSDRLSNQESKDRFLQEIAITSVLEHPNIMPVYSSGYLPDGSLAFVMKEIRGGTLKDYLEETKKWRHEPGVFRDLLEIFLKVCDAMDYAHSKGIVHRDLKPANIAVGDFGEVIVMDWGIAQWIDDEEEQEVWQTQIIKIEDTRESGELTMQGAIMGTPGYLSPEQAKGKHVDHRSDIYALGVIFYKILTMKIPFEGKSKDRIMATLMKDPTPADEIQVSWNVPSELSAIAMKALEKRRAKRYQTAGEMKEDIELYLEGHSVSAKDDTLWERGQKWVKRNQGLTIGLVGCVFAVIISILAMAVFIKKSRKNRIEEYWQKAQKIISEDGVYTASELAEKYKKDKVYSSEREVVRKEREKSLRHLLKAKSFIEKARELDANNVRLREKLIEVEKEIGKLALLGRNYMLARLSFEKCMLLGDSKGGEKMLNRLEEKQTEIKEAQKARIQTIMDRLAQSPPEEGMIDEYVTEILRMPGNHTVGKLLHFVESDNRWQRLLAIEALGKMGNDSVFWQGRDVGDWLMKRLREINLKKNISEAESLIWALGRLECSRAASLVMKVRLEAGKNSAFWQKTRLPYQWLPLEKDLTGEVGNRVDRLLQTAILKREKENYEGALSDLDRALSINSQRADLYHHRAQVYMKMKKWDKAYSDYSQMLKIEPKSVVALHNRAYVLGKKGEIKKGLKDCKKALKIDPKKAEIFFTLGYLFERIKKVKEAIANYSRAIDLNPRYIEAYYKRAHLYLKSGRRRRAIEDLSRLIQHNSNHAKAFARRGLIRVMLEDWQRALEDCSQAIRINPRLPLAYTNRGIARYQLKDFKGALEDFDEALSLDPDNAQAYWGKGLVYNKQKDYNKALQAFQKSLDKKSNYYPVFQSRALMFMKAKKYERAIRDWNRLIKSPGKDSKAYNWRGVAYIRLDKFQKALRDFDKAIQINPRVPLYYKNRAVAYHKMGKKSLAARSFKKYLSFNPKESEKKLQTYRNYVRKYGSSN